MKNERQIVGTGTNDLASCGKLGCGQKNSPVTRSDRAAFLRVSCGCGPQERYRLRIIVCWLPRCQSTALRVVPPFTPKAKLAGRLSSAGGISSKRPFATARFALELLQEGGEPEQSGMMLTCVTAVVNNAAVNFEASVDEMYAPGYTDLDWISTGYVVLDVCVRGRVNNGPGNIAAAGQGLPVAAPICSSTIRRRFSCHCFAGWVFREVGSAGVL